MPLDTLRNATSDYHRKLEAAIDWMEAFQSYASYRGLLERFARIVPPLEQAIAGQLASEPPPEFDASVRTRWLNADLTAVNALMAESGWLSASKRAEDGLREANAPSSAEALTARDFEYIDSPATAIGALYVLEGSSLGGQFLSRQLHDRLQVTPANGGAYFAAYGAATARHWHAFRNWANSQLVDNHSTRRAADAAQLTFARFGKALASFPYE